MKIDVTKPTTALLVIDMQEAFFEQPSLASQKERVVEHCNKLIRHFNKQAMPVFLVHTEHTLTHETWTLNMLDDKQGYLFAGDEHTRVVAGLLVGKAKHIVKIRDSAFFKTNLHHQLESLGVRHVVICGVSTQNCILQTAVDAYSYNFRVIVASDAIATHEPTLHEPALDLLERDYRQQIIDTDTIIASLKSLTPYIVPSKT